MKIGIFGDPNDHQCKALAGVLYQRGVQPIVIDSGAIHQGGDFSYHDGDFFAQGQALQDVKAWFLRYVISPMPPAFRVNEEYILFKDWFTDYMHRQERYAFQLAMLLSWGARGIPVMNPPEHGGVLQIKPFQLDMARLVGLKTPQTLVTNDPERVRQFEEKVGEVVYKPSMGGALCEALDESALARLDLIQQSPVIFQERIRGTSIRLTIVGDKVVSSVRIPTDNLDYRNAPEYQTGQQVYEHQTCPGEIAVKSAQLMRKTGLLFSGIDFILQENGEWVFLEANSSPIYADIEKKMQAPITSAIADYLVLLANDPAHYKKLISQAARTQSFIKYALG